MEFSFNMTAQDYYDAWSIKNKIINNNAKKKYWIALTAAVIMILLLTLLLTAITKNLYHMLFFIGYILLIVILIAVKNSGRKKAVQNQFNESAVLQSKHTLRTYSEGLEILNSYEKMFVPWKSVYFAGENDRYFIILPTYAKGILAIDKNRFASQELDKIKAEILGITHFEGGRI